MFTGKKAVLTAVQQTVSEPLNKEGKLAKLAILQAALLPTAVC